MRMKTYAAPCRASAPRAPDGAPTSAIPPDTATLQPKYAALDPSEAVSSCCCDQLPPERTKTYAEPG